MSHGEAIGVQPIPTPTYIPSDGLRGLYNAPKATDQVIRSCIIHDPNLDYEVQDRPSIQFQPSRQDFDARVARQARKRGNDLMPALPEGFPKKITSCRAWSRGDVEGVEDFIVHLSDEEIGEVKDALKYFLQLPGNIELDKICQELFPLPKLGTKLRDISSDLHSGRGIAILRGLEPKEFSPHENVVLFAGLASYIGERRGCQDQFGSMLTHLVDMGFRFGEDSKRTPSFTTGALPYHNDLCDILAMYIQECASNSGESMLASSAAVYNEIAATRPDLIKVLADPIWIYDKDKPPSVWTARPILFLQPKYGPFFYFSRQKITGSENYPLSPSLPAMTEEQAEALDLIHFVAEKNGLTMSLDPGDILLCNNLGLLHGRKNFTDASEGGKRRHFLRLWVRDEEKAWKTPPELEHDWHLVYGGSERRSHICWRINPEDVDKVLSLDIK